MKMGMTELSAYQVASIRVLSAGIVLLPLAADAFRKLPPGKLGLVILSGLLGTFFPAYLFCIAETKLDSALAGILNALTPLYTLVIGALFFKSRIPLRKWLGVLIGFCGLVLLLLSGHKNISWQFTGYAGYIILATLFYGINVNLVGRHLRELGSRQIAVVAFSILTIPALIILFLTGYFQSFNGSGPWLYATGASFVLGVIGTAVASILFYVLLKRAGTLFASMVTYGIPFVAVGWGILANETVTLLQLLCLAVILGGVYLANK
jgi:drug/metabolite transporter (DMT)-like permease